MAANSYPTPSDRETFAIALERALDDDQRRGVQQLLLQLEALGDAESAAMRRIRANKAARGEKLPRAGAYDHLLDDDIGLEPMIAEHLRGLPDARGVLKATVHAYQSLQAFLRRNLHLVGPPEDIAIQAEVLEQWQAFLAAATAFIADPAWARDVAREVARNAVGGGSGGAVFAVVEGETHGVDMDGKALSRHFDRLEKLAADAGLTSLGEYFGFGEDPDADWFDPAPAQATAAALVAAISPLKLKEKKALRADLEALQETLAAAATQGRRFHLEVDF